MSVEVSSVEYNGGSLPDIVYSWPYILCDLFPPTKRFDIFPPLLWSCLIDGGCSEGLDAFRFFLKHYFLGTRLKSHAV